MWPFRRKPKTEISLVQQVAVIADKAALADNRKLADLLMEALSRYMRLDKPRG